MTLFLLLDESEADVAVELETHKLDGKPIRVSYAQKNASSLPRASKKADVNILDCVTLPHNQTRVYLGPVSKWALWNIVFHSIEMNIMHTYVCTYFIWHYSWKMMLITLI